MQFLYDLSIFFYGCTIRLASLFNKKARRWIIGRKGLMGRIQRDFPCDHRIIWFHCASLGEFEQGKPVMEKIRKRYPGRKMLITFFSPSGYEIRKDYAGADFVYYLPLDTPLNAKRFVEAINPEMAVFVKYEFWFNYFRALNERNIPLLLISAHFRPDQRFFKWYGRWFRKGLKRIDRIFVQHPDSVELLKSTGYHDVDYAGDTRFDRVVQTVKGSGDMPAVRKFLDGKRAFVAGSSWPPDETIFLPLLDAEGIDLKMIIAPHDVSRERIEQIRKSIHEKVILYSEMDNRTHFKERVLIVDAVGPLKQIYRYAHIAYIGGAFGSGLHNILEAAAFGKPVIFGPDHAAFWEAGALIKHGGAFSVESAGEFLNIFRDLWHHEEKYEKAGAACTRFVRKNSGAAQIIVDKMKPYMSGYEQDNT